MAVPLKQVILFADAPDGERVLLGVTEEGHFAIARRGDLIRCGSSTGKPIEDCVQLFLKITGLIQSPLKKS